MRNPLIGLDQLPPFSKISPAHMAPAIDDITRRGRAAIDELVLQEQPTWDSLMRPLEDIGDELERAWSPISHLNAVVNSDALRDAYNACLPILTRYNTELGQHKGFFRAIEALAGRADELDLDPVQRKILRDDLRDFRLAGIDLPPEQQQRFGEIRQRLSELTSKFEENLLDATMAWSCHFDEADALRGLPESALASARQAARQKDLEGYLVTLEFPSYHAVITYADDRQLRDDIYRAYSTRASDQGPHAGEYDNSDLMDEILALRHELADLLGFDNFSELSLATKMATSPDQVLEFLRDLAEKSRPQAKTELAELQAFASEQGIDNLCAWDLAYYSEKLRIKKHNISQEEVRPWFPESQVIEGLFAITGRLFHITFKERVDVDTWHPDVRFFDIFDLQGEHRASFYLDLYARPHKRGGAWMADAVGRRRLADGSLQKPVAFLTCNFNGPVEGQPALFTHDEVVTLFHEFGHGLHHMLTQIDYAAVSGISGVPWDAVELPSQFLENFCWTPEGLALIARHHETGESLPADLLERLLAARNFQSAMQMLRQIEFSLFDFEMHRYFDPDKGADIQQTLDRIRAQVAVMRPPSFNRFQHSFSHIFAGGYAAGYYSYKWAEVLSSDAFSRFEEEGLFNPAVGQDFLNKILEKGGSEEPAELFRAFRGRDPEVDALLRHSGIAVAQE